MYLLIITALRTVEIEVCVGGHRTEVLVQSLSELVLDHLVQSWLGFTPMAEHLINNESALFFR